MERQITEMIAHIAKSHQQLAKVLEAGRDVSAHMSYLVNSIPDDHFTFDAFDTIVKSASDVTANVVSYLNSIGGLEEALADNLEFVMKEMDAEDAEE